MEFKLSNQAIGALMLALQKGILEQVDITEILQEFDFVDTEDGLLITNPPLVHATSVEPEKESSA